MTAMQARLWTLYYLDENDPVEFSMPFLQMTGQGYDLGDVVKYDGHKFKVVEIHHTREIVKVRRM